ncbi:MAG: GNAT family N-acetyltransferase [Caldilineaceae bacterium]
MEFYPIDASVPTGIRTDRLLLRPLTVAHVDLDYAAVMASREQLNRWSQTTWPTPDFTLAENRADLERHQREHLAGVAFTYTVLNPAENRCLGCVYIAPVPQSAQHIYTKEACAANVTFWVRSDELHTDLDSHLLATLRAWFAAEWLFARVIFTISPQNPSQAALLEHAGLTEQPSLVLTDGRPRRVYTE